MTFNACTNNCETPYVLLNPHRDWSQNASPISDEYPSGGPKINSGNFTLGNGNLTIETGNAAIQNGTFSVNGDVTVTDHNLRLNSGAALGIGDIYLSNGKAIRADAATDTTINFSNYGLGDLTVNIDGAATVSDGLTVSGTLTANNGTVLSGNTLLGAGASAGSRLTVREVGGGGDMVRVYRDTANVFSVENTGKAVFTPTGNRAIDTTNNAVDIYGRICLNGECFGNWLEGYPGGAPDLTLRWRTPLAPDMSGWTSDDFLRNSGSAVGIGLVGGEAIAYPLDVSGNTRISGGLGLGGSAPVAGYGLNTYGSAVGGYFLDSHATNSYLAYRHTDGVDYGLFTNGTIFTATDAIVGGNLNVNGNTTLGNDAGDTVTFNARAISLPSNLNLDGNTLFVNSSTDRVGIGTAAPGYDLDVNGDARVVGQLGVGMAPIDTNGISAYGTTAGGYFSNPTVVSQLAYTAGGFNYGLNTTGLIYTSSDAIVNGDTTLGNAASDTVTVKAGTVSVPNNLNFDSGTLFIDSTNNRVGIGTASPQYGLDVSGTLHATGAAQFDSDLNVAGTLTAGNINLVNITASGDVAVNGGDITSTSANASLFNTNSTTGTVNVAGFADTLNLGGDLTDVNLAGGFGSTGCTIDGTTGALTCTGGIVSEGEPLPSGGGENGAVTYWTGGSILDGDAANFYWNSGNKRLGLGTNAPDYPLDIKSGTSTTAEMRLNDFDGNAATRLWTGVAMSRENQEKWFIGMDDNAADTLQFRGSNNPRVTMKAQDTQTFNVTGQICLNGSCTVDWLDTYPPGTTDGNILHWKWNGTKYTWMTTDLLNVKAAGIKAGTNVGINDDAVAGYALYVDGLANAGVYGQGASMGGHFVDTTTSVYSQLASETYGLLTNGVISTTSDAIIGGNMQVNGNTTLGSGTEDNVTFNADSLIFPNSTSATLANAVNAFSLDGTTFSVDALNNRIGIGTASPQYTLDVTGDLRVTGDTVFEGDVSMTGGVRSDGCFGSVFVGLSSGSYTPTQIKVLPGGGYAGINGACSSYGASSHACTVQEMLESIRCGAVGDPIRTIPNGSHGWLNGGPPGYTANANDCEGWTQTGSNFYARFWAFNNTGDNGYGVMTSCNTAQPKNVACCK